MFAGLKAVNYNELHNRQTFMVFDVKEGQKAADFHYALIVGREKENHAKTPYVCYYVGLTEAEYVALRKLPESLRMNLTFLGIPNDTIDVSHDVYRVFLQEKPVAWAGIDYPAYDHDEFVAFVKQILRMKELIACHTNDPSSLSSRMQLELQTATKASSAESQPMQV